MAVRTGLEVLLDSERELLKGRRFGLIAHPASVSSELTHSVELLREAYGAGLVRLFAPEHGLGGEAQDMASVSDQTEAGSGLEVVSLYGDTEASLSPSLESLSDLEALVCDLQDVGARYYTFQATLARAMTVAAEAGVEVIVLDRPNPLGGLAIEGPPVDESYRSFVGIESIPVRHGMTMAELARFYAAECERSSELTVVPMQGWSRDMWFDETGLTWVLPSPNMPTLETASVYPGTCLVEGTNLSEGRGTTRPLELLGAPWIDGARLRDSLRALDLPGAIFRAASFRPGFQKHVGRDCGGIEVRVADRARFEPFLTGVAIIAHARTLDPENFDWRRETYEFVDDRLAIDLLAGSPALREAIEAGHELSAIRDTWRPYEAEFAERRAPYLLY